MREILARRGGRRRACCRFSICEAKKSRKRIAASVPDAATSAGTTGPAETSAGRFLVAA
jgi:hypothetical protein